jgi:hypothetical protein
MTIPAGHNNHVEMVFRPGELDKAMKLLALLGCEPKSSPYPYKGVHFHYAKSEQLWISEVTPEQWAFELWLQDQLKTHGDAASAKFLSRLEVLPQAHAHFGIGARTLEEWERITADVARAAAEDPDLKGRVFLPVRQRPEDPGSVCATSGGQMGRTLYQAFVRTDLISTGLLTLGQSIEIQHYRENDPAYDGAFTPLQAGAAA